MKTYRVGFLLALIGNIVLALVLAGLWLHYRAAKPMTDSETKKDNSTAQDSMSASMAMPVAATEAPLVPTDSRLTGCGFWHAPMPQQSALA